MREYAKVSPKFWINLQGRCIKKLGVEAQLIALYLITNPHANMLGIYYLAVTTIAHETGLSIENALNGLQRLCDVDFCSYDTTLEYVWVHDMAFDQIASQLKSNDNRVKAVNDIYQALPDLSFLTNFFNKYSAVFFLHAKQGLSSYCEGPLEPLRSQEKEQEKDQEKDQEQKQKKELFMSGKPDVYPLCENKSFFENKSQLQPLSNSSSLKSQAVNILQFLNTKTGRVYRPVDTNLKLIIARLKSGASEGQCFQVIAKKTREWKGEPKMAEYLRPATLFNAMKFEQYVGELVLPKAEEEMS